MHSPFPTLVLFQQSPYNLKVYNLLGPPFNLKVFPSPSWPCDIPKYPVNHPIVKDNSGQGQHAPAQLRSPRPPKSQYSHHLEYTYSLPGPPLTQKPPLCRPPGISNRPDPPKALPSQTSLTQDLSFCSSAQLLSPLLFPLQPRTQICLENPYFALLADGGGRSGTW